MANYRDTRVGDAVRPILFAFMLAIASLWSSVAVAASVQKEFQAIWSARDGAYRAERVVLEKAQQDLAAVAVRALIANDPAAPKALNDALIAARKVTEVIGRGRTLWAFRNAMATKPSWAAAEAWMQGQTDEFSSASRLANEEEARVRAMIPGQTVSVTEWAGAVEKIVMMRGTLEGQAAELNLIDQNAEIYYRALGQQEARRSEKRKAFLSAFGEALVQQQQNTAGWSVQCSQFGNQTTCFGK